MVHSNTTGSTSVYTTDERYRDACHSDSHMDGFSRLLKSIAVILLLLAFMTLSISPCLARENDNSSFSILTADWGFEETYFYSSLYIKHHDPKPHHVNDQNMLGFEGETKDKRVLGLALFDNSFGQESQYLYIGKKWRQFRSDQWYLKLTGGLLNGYKEPYEDKIPLNDLGVAPVIIPTLGYRGKSFFAEFNQLGLAASMITVGFIF
jgi:hypothetical protein